MDISDKVASRKYQLLQRPGVRLSHAPEHIVHSSQRAASDGVETVLLSTALVYVTGWNEYKSSWYIRPESV
eukprot:6182557-Pleurochrysis_carterae.AAC.7